MVRLAPSILAANFAHLGDDIEAAVRGGADLIHCDVMDGHFVPNISYGAMIVEVARNCTTLPIDTHLMIAEPEKYVPDFAKAGSDIISIHAEATPHAHRAVAQIKENGCKAGIALNPSSPLSLIEELLGDVDQVIIMTVNPGFGGQKFIRSMLDKISRLHVMKVERGLHFDIEIDGGVGQDNAAEIAEAGATILVAGSSVFASADIGQAAAAIRSHANAAFIA